MAIMRATRSLRSGPFGDALNISAEKLKKVRILDQEASLYWVKIELIESDTDPKPVGWVSRDAVDIESDVLKPLPLDKADFAAYCIEAGEDSGVQIKGHYLMAIANLRTNVNDGPRPNGIDYGPYAFSPEEWKTLNSGFDEALQFREDQIQSWMAQCEFFGVITRRTIELLAKLLKRYPTYAEVTLAQMIGTSASATAIKSQHEVIMDIVRNTPTDELSSDGIDGSRLPKRYGDVLNDGTTGEQALTIITTVLNKSLDETRLYLEKAATSLLQDAVENTGVRSSDFVSAEIAGKNGIKYSAGDGSTMIRSGGSVSWRQQNPGNIKKGKFADEWAIGDGPVFAIFPSEAVGLQVIVKLLSGKNYRDLTLLEAMERYAPSGDDNHPLEYAKFLSTKTGIDLNATLRDIEIDKLFQLARSIKTFEGWKEGTEKTTPATDDLGVNGVTVKNIVRAAVIEWEYWGKSTNNAIARTEESDGYAEYVYDKYYLSVAGKKKNVQEEDQRRTRMIARIEERPGVKKYPWSAIAISYIMRNAGFTKQQFKFAEGHHSYIRAAVEAKAKDDTTAFYWGYRIHEIAPQPGDIVGCARGGVPYAAAQNYYDKTAGYESHADIVVATRPGEVDVIGGNVSDSVTMTTMKTDANGILIDQSKPWFVVMKLRLPG